MLKFILINIQNFDVKLLIYNNILKRINIIFKTENKIYK